VFLLDVKMYSGAICVSLRGFAGGEDVFGGLRGLRRVVQASVVSFTVANGVIGKIGTNLGTVLVTIASEKYCNSLTGEALELESSLSSYVSCFP
jgi:hypothetical protein